MKLSVLMPVFNEKASLREIVQRVLAVNLDKELIMINDCSDDGSKEIMDEIKLLHPEVIVHHHSKNMGKGTAIRTALKYATGDFIVIQDADLEYDPQEYHKLFEPVERFGAVAVYGSRFTGIHKNMFFWHLLGNKFLSFMTDLLYNTTLTDMETCYKLIRSDVIKQIPLQSRRFEFEPEITAKILKRKVRIFEVPISYAGREFDEGKKITWRDGFIALWTLFKYRFVE